MKSLGFGLTNAQKGLITAVVSAGLGLAVAFGFNMTADQVAAIVAFVNTILALWIGFTAGGSPALDSAVSPITGKSSTRSAATPSAPNP